MKAIGALWWLLPNGRPIPAKGARPHEVTAFAHEGDEAWTPIAATAPRPATIPMVGVASRREVNEMFRSN
jgi:hypothetical protein